MEDRFRERDGEFASKWDANLHGSGRNGLQIAGEISGDRHGPKATGRPKVLRPKMVETMTCLLIGKTLLDRVGACHAPPQDRHRSAPYSPLRSAPLRTDLRRIASHRLTRYRHTHIEITRHTFDAVTFGSEG